MKTPDERGTPAQGKDIWIERNIFGAVISLYPTKEAAVRKVIKHRSEGYPVDLVKVVCVEGEQ